MKDKSKFHLQNQNAIEQLKNALDLSHVICITDYRGIILHTNRNFCAVSEYNLTELIGKKFSHVSSKLYDISFFKKNPDIISSGKSWSGEIKIKTKSGKFLWLATTKVPILNSEQKIYQYILISTEITERKRAELLLQKKVKEKSKILNSISQSVISLDKNWRYTFLNDAALATHPGGREAAYGKIIWDVHPELIGTNFEHKYRESMNLKKVVEYEDYYAPMDTWFSVKVYPSNNGITVFYHDITVRKKAELDALIEKDFSDAIINSLPGIFYLYNKDGKFERWNKNFETVSGYSADEIAKMKPLDFFDDEDKKILSEKIATVFEKGGAQVESFFYTKTHKKIPYIFTGFRKTFNGIDYLLGVGIDLSERYQARQKLIESEARLVEAQDVAKIGSWETILTKPAVIWSRGTYDIMEFDPPPEGIKHPSIRDFIHPEDKERVEKAYLESLNSYSTHSITHRVITAKQNLKYIEERWRIVFDEEGIAQSAVGTCQDITDRIKAEIELKNSEAKYRYLFNNSPAVIIIWDVHSLSVLEVNDLAVETYGYTREEFLKLTVLELRPEEDREKIKNFSKEIAHARQDKLRRTWRHLKKNGELMYMDIASHRIDYNGKKVVLSLAKDITEQVKAEIQLQETYNDIRRLNAHLQTIREEERASIGREIHDELGQQLTAIKMDVSWLNKELQSTSASASKRISEVFLLIDNAVNTVRRISSDLRPAILEDLGLIAALEWQCKEFEKRLNIPSQFLTEIDDVEIESTKAINVFRIHQESLTNIMRHANAKQVYTTLRFEDKCLVLVIEDEGEGFEIESVKSKKTLGLTGIRERALMLDGTLTIESKKGKGTKIVLKIPIQ